MTTVAFIGLGIMGGPMAANLVSAGFDVVGHNRTPAKAERLALRAQGDGGLDHSALFRLVARLSGRDREAGAR